MTLRRHIAHTLNNRLGFWALGRQPDLVIGEPHRPYMRRWWLIPRNKLFNVYLHNVLRSDDDRALHDHPWWNLSFLLGGSYVEHTIQAGGVERRVLRKAGDLVLRSAKQAHRLEITKGPCWSLFITGPAIRVWGFHCPKAGWVDHDTFAKTADGVSTISRGCGED